MRKLSLVALATLTLLGVAAPAKASPITFTFSGPTNLGVFGGPAVANIQGSATYDTITADSNPDPNVGLYAIASATFSINSTSFTGNIAPPSHVNVYNNVGGNDLFSLILTFAPPLDFGSSVDVGSFAFDLFLPISAFTSTALPGNLDFLSLATGSVAFVAGQQGDVTAGLSNFTVGQAANAVPEPATLSLLGLGLIGAAVVRYRRRR